MARAVILPSQTSTQTLLFSIPKIPLTTWKLPFMSLQVLCKCSSAQAAPASAVVDMAKYKEAFARRMAMAGLKPHHRIAIGVSGGPDSMALCVLSAHWKAQDFNAKCDNGGFVDGLLAIIVDHGLRAESKEEANTVSNRVSKMGIRSYIACCDWPDGHPKQGHLQEAARDMRYEMFQNICIRNRIGVLLIAHHADDQTCSRLSYLFSDYLAIAVFLDLLVCLSLLKFSPRIPILVPKFPETMVSSLCVHSWIVRKKICTRYVKEVIRSGWKIQRIKASYMLVTEFDCP